MAEFKKNNDSKQLYLDGPVIESEKIIQYNQNLKYLFSFSKDELIQGRTYEVFSTKLKERIQKTFIKDVIGIKNESEIEQFYRENYLI